MDYLWSPWRYRYVTSGGPKDQCIFWAKGASTDDRADYVVLRGELNFVVLNLYPYTNGHLMVAPYAHVGTLEQSETPVLEEMMRLTARAEAALRNLYKPNGFNIGMNLGHSAGAGVAGHIHMHVVPRWIGDSSFITTVSETRVLPEDLGTTWERLTAEFKK